MIDLIDYDEFVDDVKAESDGRKPSAAVDKVALRNVLDEQLAKYLANGGKIHQVVNEVIEVNHGTATQYKKFGCRCQKCSNWKRASLNKK